MNKVTASKFNKPIVLIMVLALLLLLVLVFSQADHESELESAMKTEHALHDHANHSAVSNKVDNHAHVGADTHVAADTDAIDDSGHKDAMPRHQDMLTEEMKQGIRDKLFFHGPKEVIQHPDGKFELPSNGRFTQMPVAVKMPDGTIQIKEYSSLPE